MGNLPALCAAVLLWACAVPAAAQPQVRAGEYLTHEAWGHLSIKGLPGGKLAFAIETVGINGHMCDFDGLIKEGAVVVNPAYADPGCVVTFKPQGNLIEVVADNSACRHYCGARAGFTGIYYLPPEGCKADQQIHRRAEFLRHYRTKNYARALVLLEGFYSQCKDFLHWLTEIDGVRNDLAITQFHLGRHSDCLQTLATTRAGPFKNESQMQEKTFMAPSDLETYLPTAQQIWHNQKLCSKSP